MRRAKESAGTQIRIMAVAYAVDTDISKIYAYYTSDLLTIRNLHESGESSREVVREITEATDTLNLRLLLDRIQRILQRDELPGHILLLAQGGYGRREQHPQSDIDLLFLFNQPLSDPEEELIKETFRCLFDLGLRVGHCCRSYRQALDMVSQDPHSQTAMCESRFLAGDWRLFEQFKHDLWSALSRNRYEYIKQKITERGQRTARHGTTINISEPNIKESPGGLRDYHFGLWIGSLLKNRNMNLLHLKRSYLIDDQMMAKVDEALQFLWRLRNDLHFLTGKEQDILAMPLQHQVSQRLGYQDRRGRLAEEEMMHDYYKHALTLRQFAEHMIRQCTRKSFWSFLRPQSRKPLSDGFILCETQIHIPQDINFFEHHPRRLLRAFIHAAEQGAALSEDTTLAIRDNLHLVDQAFLHDKQNAADVRQFFALPQSIEPAVNEMRRTGFLDSLFPEWRGIAYLVRYDLVHRFTVDEHSILCLYHLEHLEEDRMNYARERHTLWQECKEKDVLRLAVLFHDIGKGRDEDHSEVGARLVDTIARRMRLPEEKRERLCFLVKYHLLMSHTAQHRDLSDPQAVAVFSDAFEPPETLDMMYLLTYVDMRSVSPEAMTEWKNNLLWELYLATRDIFVSECLTEEQRNIQVVSRKETFIADLAKEFDRDQVREHLDNLPPSYLHRETIDNIRRHLAAIRSFDGKTPITRFYPHPDSRCRDIVLVCRDKVGLFNRICTAVMLENFTIVEARLNTRNDGLVANNIVIRDTLGGDMISETRQRLLQDRITRLLLSEGEVPPVPKPPGFASLGRSSFESCIHIMNNLSARFTVIEVRCPDRPQLLQDLTSVLSRMNMNIHFARIITEGNRITDVFYVTDPSGERIQQEETLDHLRQALEACLGLCK